MRCQLLKLQAVVVLVVVIFWGATTTACDTPVYRYAMYRWEPTPYEVYHFHNGAMDKAFASAQNELSDARNHDVAPANVAIYPVDLAEDKELKTVPRDVRRLWQKKVEKGITMPATIVVNPKGFEVHTGEISDVGAFVQSPMRKEIGDLLSKGHCGVYVLVYGKDEALNKAAAEAVDKVIKDVNSGDLSLYSGPSAYDPLQAEKQSQDDSKQKEKETTKDDAEKKQSAHSAVALKYSPKVLEAKDPWFYRSLMAVENDLHEFTDEPMLFVVYGRGRALPPYIGKGIVYQNLVEVTDFVTSACSCTVKDQNPGVDLLMSFDWESASAAVAKRFGSEEGNNESLDDLFPQLIFPGKAPEKSTGESTKQPDVPK